MAYWRDNADSYICSACGYECNNPNQLPTGPGVCPNCKSKMVHQGTGSTAIQTNVEGLVDELLDWLQQQAEEGTT